MPTLTDSFYPSTASQLSQLTTASAPTPRTKQQPEEEVDTVMGAGLRSTILEQQHRIDRLENEKMQMSMSMAPMEARFRQKEDTWTKEQNRLIHEVDELRYASREADERYRDLVVKCDALEEECTQLRFAARKASSSLNVQHGDSTAWSRQLQNDRDVADLKEKLRNAEEEITSLRLEKVSVEKEVNATRIELNSVLRSFDELQGEYDEVAASKSNNKEAEIKLEVLTQEHIATAAQLNAVCSDLAATRARSEATIEAKDGEHKKELAGLQFEMSVLKTRASKVLLVDDTDLVNTEEEDDAVLKARIEERDRRIGDLEAQLLEGEQLRRQMHNRIQELRGNIRVYVRTRPFLPGDGGQTEPSIDACPDGESLSIVDHRGNGDHSFKFDKVFMQSSGQDAVFSEVSDFVQSALDGYHVCLFSYGQTGSGKTHTMQGSGNGVMRGIIPRAVEKILEQAKMLQTQKWDFKMSASFLEIYNEELKDLLVTMKPGGGKGAKAEKLSIKRNREGKSYVDNLAEVAIDTNDSMVGMQQLETLMESAARSRSVASTKMNAQSSRSHSVFMLHLRGYNEDSGAYVHGALNLCDLAGSERLDRSGAGADAKRLRETQAINKSLSCLGDVFNALATGASHVPYRNSKLTYLLQDCLSGDGKALMFVNLSPTLASSNESLCSLRFAQRVNSVELGKATKNIEYSKSKR
jgi:kinesin family protein C1